MYGLISQIQATPGNRKKLADILLKGTAEMPGCQLYAIAADEADDVSLWITEVWDSEDAHKASLELPAVQEAMTTGRPFIAGFAARHIVNPLGGAGLEKPAAK